MIAAGSYVLTVSAQDIAGNSATATVSFVIDRTPPVITVTGVSENECVQGPVTPVITVTDTYPKPAATVITLDGHPFVSGTAVSAAGSYILAVSAADLAGNTSSATVTFTLDPSPPTIAITGVTNGEVVNIAQLVPVVTVTDPGTISSQSVTLDGQPFVSGTAVTAAGNYTLAVSATNCAGLTSTAQVIFAIDRTPPVIVITGVSSGECTNGTVTPVVTVSDSNPNPSLTVITLNGVTFTSGTSITAQGAYVLAVSATDLAGNSSSASVSFIIDKSAPAITITGVTNNEVTNAASVTPIITITDSGTLTSQSVTLNGQTFVSGTAVSTAGSYTLAVTATNCAGLTSTAQVVFAIDRTPPVITITGVTSNECTSSSVTPVITITNSNPNSSLNVITLNGQPFTSGTTVTAQGVYTLAVSATDLAGNRSSTSITFTVDKTAPTITVAGVTAGEVTNVASLSPTVTITDTGTLTSQSITLNGQPYVSGTAITTAASYTLAASATNCAGLSSSASVSFTIYRTPPVITITGVTNGEITNAASLTATITVSSPYPNPADTVITLNGQTYVSGTAITTAASYTLTVSAQDLAGNTASTTLTFVIYRTAPVIAVTGVTNGEVSNGPVTPVITVTDAYPNPSATVITLDGQPFASGTTITAMGDHTLAVTATDLAGNTSSVSLSFDVRGPPPSFGMGSARTASQWTTCPS